MILSQRGCLLLRKIEQESLLLVTLLFKYVNGYMTYTCPELFYSFHVSQSRGKHGKSVKSDEKPLPSIGSVLQLLADSALRLLSSAVGGRGEMALTAKTVSFEINSFRVHPSSHASSLSDTSLPL